jgi:hypothetical protein
MFPAIHDTPRAATTLDPVQVQQATDDLIIERNHLTAEAQAAGQKNGANASANAATPQPAKNQIGGPAAAGAGQAAGTETK